MNYGGGENAAQKLLTTLLPLCLRLSVPKAHNCLLRIGTVWQVLEGEP